MTAPFRLDGKKALVTGGASGIGEATSKVLTAAGASVVILDVDRRRAETLAGTLPGSSVAVCDVTDEQQVKELFAGMASLDILVNNAGVGMVGSIEETPLEEFRRLMAVNVEGPFLITKYALPLLVASHGSIVNIGSVAGLVGVKRRFAYCASKGAVVNMTRALALDHGPQNIRVNCVCPGDTNTGMLRNEARQLGAVEEQFLAEAADRPLGRVGTPEEIAQAVLYLASEASSFVTGTTLVVDGGGLAG